MKSKKNRCLKYEERIMGREPYQISKVLCLFLEQGETLILYLPSSQDRTQ